MPSFDELFLATIGSNPIEYKGQQLIRLDHIQFNDGDRFKFVFESINSNWRQGILLSIFGLFEYNDKQWPDRILFWQDTCPKEVIVTVYQEKSKRKQPKNLPKKGLLGIKNIWDSGNGRVDSWFGGAAMKVKEIPNGRRYYCNDGHPDENFDDIIFSIQKVSG